MAAGLPQRFYIGRVIAGRPRLAAAILLGVALELVLPATIEPATRPLIAWNVATIFYIAITLATMARASAKTIRWRARSTDEGRFAILILTAVAAAAAMVAIFAQLSLTKDMKGLDKELHIALAAVTIVTAWVFIHLTFALHYAHEFFDETKTEEGEKPELKGGVNFPGTDEPDYWDFLYFSFIIGVASQTADVSITSKVIRRTSLAHSILAFFFNSAVLALTINIASSLI